MNLKLNPLYKKLLMLSLVLGPAFWLILTEDGQRRADIVLIKVLEGGQDFNLSFAKLHPGATEADLLASFPDVEFHCESRDSEFGDRLCQADIVSFNAAPAKRVSVFFDNGATRAVRLIYRPAHHDFVVAHLVRELGQPQTAAAGETTLYQWTRDDGMVVVPQAAPEQLEDASIMWLGRGRAGPLGPGARG
jgi:hypothetical protein